MNANGWIIFLIPLKHKKAGVFYSPFNPLCKFYINPAGKKAKEMAVSRPWLKRQD